MKKIMAVLMTMILAVGLLGGCSQQSGSSGTGSDSKKQESTAPESKDGASETEASVQSTSQSVAASVETANSAGSIHKVGYIPLMTNTDFHLSLAEAIVGALNGAGFEADYTSPDGDITKQIEIVENYVAMGYDCIVLFPLDGNALSDAVSNAMANGVKVLVMVNETTVYDAAMLSDQSVMGQAVCELAADWVEKTFPDAADGSVECAFISYYADDNTKAYSEALKKIEEYSSKIKVVTEYEQPDEEQATGQSIAENLYTQYPDVKLFICTSGTIALGVNAYYTSMDSPVDDLSALGVFSINGNIDTYKAIKASVDNKAIYRGIALASDINGSAQTVVRLVTAINEGTITDENKRYVSEAIKVTAENAEEYIDE